MRQKEAIDTYLEKNGIEYETVKLKENQNILEWWDDFQVQQTDDVWKAHGEWIRKKKPKVWSGSTRTILRRGRSERGYEKRRKSERDEQKTRRNYSE